MTSSRPTYTPDRRGFAKLMKSGEVGAMCVSAAKKGAEFAESIAPVLTGEYAASFVVEAVSEDSDRAGARLVNISDHAVFVEWGANGAPGQNVLGRAADYIEREGP